MAEERNPWEENYGTSSGQQGPMPWEQSYSADTTEKPRTWGEAAKDTGAALMQGGAGLVKSAGDLYGLASGDMNNAVSQLGQSGQEYWEEAKSGALRRKIAKRKEDIDASPSTLGKAWTAVKETVTDPALAMDTVAGNAATMLPGMAAGRLAAGAKMAAGMKAAQELGPVALGTQEALATQAARLGTGVAVGTGAAQQGADVSGDIYSDVMKKPDATLDANPEFAQAVARNGGDREAAKREMATQVARASFLPAAGISAVANAFPGATMLEKSLIGGAARDTIKEGTKYAIPKAIAKGMAGEGTQEFVEEGGGRLAANIAAQKIADPSHDTWDQVGENAGMGLAGGLLMGAGGGAFHRQAHTNQPTPPEQPPQPPSDQSTGVGSGMGGTESFVPPAFTTNPQPTTLGTQITATAGPGFDANSVLPKSDPVRDMVQQAADAGGPNSAAALVGIDSGAHGIEQQAAAQAAMDEKLKEASKDMPADVADAWAQYRAESAALQQDQSQPDWAAQAADEERQQGPLQIPPKGMNTEQRKANLARLKERMLAGRTRNGTTNAVQSLPATRSGIDGNQQSTGMGSGNADGNGLGADAGGHSTRSVVQSGEQPTAERAVTDKSKNLASLKEKVLSGRKTPQFQSNPQPTTLGTQTTAKAGPGFDASYLPQGTRNVSQAPQAVTSSPQQQEAGNQAPAGAATTATQSGTAGGSDVQATRVEVSQPAQSAANAGEGAGVSQPTQAAKLPPTDIRIGDKVLVDGKPHTVTQGVDGGVAVESDAQDIGSGVSNSQTRILKGDEAIKAKIAADDAGLNKPTQAASSQLALVRIKSIDGKHYHVQQSDLDSGKSLLPTYTANGKRSAVRIHRENLDPTGEKQAANNAEDANNPLFNVIATKNGAPFGDAAAANRALKIQKRGDTHEVVPASEVKPGMAGFVLRRKVNTGDKKPANKQVSEQKAQTVKDYIASVNQAKQDAQQAAQDAPREIVTPDEDKPIGQNDAGESLYERKDGSVYRMRDGKPDFGGDLAPKQPSAPATTASDATEKVAKPSKSKKPAGGKSLRAAAYDKNPLMTFLATHGLFHDKDKPNSHKSEFSPDKTIMVMGYGPVFKKTGKRLDVLTNNAIEEGYLPKDGTESQLRELVRRAIAGEKISPLYAQGISEQIAEQSYAEHLAQQQEAAQNEDFDDPFAPMLDGDFVADDFAVPGYDEASDPIKLEVNALLALADDAGINEDALDSIKEDAHYATLDQSEQAYYEAYRDAIKAAIAASGRDSSADTGETGNAQGQGSQEGLTLTSPSRQDVIAQQDALEAEAKRKEEGGDKPLPRRQLTGDVPDMFNTQGSVFDQPAEPEAPVAPVDRSEGWSVATQESPPEVKTYTAEDVAAAEKQAVQQIEAQIDKLKGDAFLKIAKRFLPTMGVKPTLSKASNKAAFTGPKVNLLAAASELGVELPASVRAALEAKQEGKVQEATADSKPTDKIADFGEKIGLFNQRDGGDVAPAEAQRVQSAIEGKSLIDAARFIAETGEQAHAEVARKVIEKLQWLQDHGADLRLIVAHRGDSVPSEMIGSRGYTQADLDNNGYDVTVWVHGADVTGSVGVDYETVLHELVHAATTGELLYARNNPNTDVGKAYADLNRVSAAVEDHINQRFSDAREGKVTLTEFEKDIQERANNAFRNLDEFVSWALTSRDAQDYLESIAYKSESLWTRFVQAIRTALGLTPNADTALSEILRVSEVFLSNNGVKDRGITAFWHKRGVKMSVTQSNGSIAIKQRDSYEAGNMGHPAASRVKFSRTAQGQANDTVEQTVADIVKGWATRPKIVVAFDMNDERIPERVRMEDQKQRSGGASGAPEGFYYKGTVYLMSSKLATPEDVARVLFHEALGHHGLRSVFGKKLNSILNRIAMARKSEVDAKMAQYGLKGISKVDRLTAAEEILAEMAQTKPNIGFVREAIAAIRTWLRENIPGFKNLELTDDEIIRSYIVPARNFVERGGAQSFGMFAPSMARDASQRESDVSPIGFYSALARGIEASTANIAPALGWKATIKGLVNKGLAKADEVEWSGVNEWLDMQGGKVAKTQVLDFLRGNGVQVQEVVNSDDPAILKNWPGDKTLPANTKYGNYTLPGGTNYREVLLTFPGEYSVGATKIAALRAREVTQKMRFAETDEEYELLRKERAGLAEKSKGGLVYKSSHWEQTNVLAHIRLNDRTDADGKRVLFVEEVQSDWGQQGKKEGFAGTMEGAKAFYGISDADWNAMSQADRQSYVDEMTGRTAGVKGGVPTAPFVTKTDAWLNLALKRIIKMAVDEGYDKVAFVNGEQSADRYDLSKQVEHIDYVKSAPDRWNIAVVTKSGDDINRDAQTADQLEDLVGKEVAQKIVGGEGQKGVGGTTLRGLDLKVGGEGMKAFYDSIVPNAVKKLVGKLGGEVGEVEVYKQGRNGMVMPNDAKPAARRDGRLFNQTGFTITPAMREKVAGGLPLFSRAAAIKKAGDVLNEAFNHPGTVSKWHTTVGSMYNLAERSPAFKPVFDAAQDFLNDVSYYGTEAANQAPKILPKLETIKDLLPGAKEPVSYEDNKAISAPIFQGTLSWARDVNGRPVLTDDLKAKAADMTAEQKAQDMLRAGKLDPNILRMWQGMEQDHYEAAVNSRYENVMLKPGVVWKDAELRSIFKLNDAQVGLYHEFRNAINTSIDNAAKASMLRTAGKDVQAMREMVMDAPTAEIAGLTLRDHLQGMAQDNQDRSDELIAMANEMMDQADKAETLKKEGYAPLSRFGHYTVDVVVNGERKYFSMFESKKAANQMANLMRQEYGRDNVAQGTMSQREFEQFQGITPESMELFGNMLGLDSTGNEAQDKAFQTYLRKTKANRSAMKRLIHRKGVAGYSDDVGRVLAAFVYSNARQTAGALNLGNLSGAVNAIPKDEGALKDVAIGLHQYITKPQEEAQAIRGMMFAQYLGGSIASMMVNLTQPMAISFPYLSQYGAGKAAKALTKAYADMKGGDRSLEGGLQQALKIAEEQGIVAPQEVHQLMAQAQGKATLNSGDGTKLGNLMAKSGNAFTRLALGWGKLFGWAEQINRKATFIAAYRMAAERGDSNPFDFAKKAVNETQFINNRGNKMQWGRGPIGATLMTFKSYSINYLELLHRMATRNGPEGKKAAAIMLGMLLLMAGAGGLPFADDLNDLLDFLAQRMGYNFSTKKAKQEFLEGLFGKAMADFIDRGITGLPGSPIDVSGRMSMANLLPGTGLLLEKRDHSKDAQELLGPVGDMATRSFQAVNSVLDGDIKRALLAVAPKAISNAAQGFDMSQKGYYADAKGYKVLSTTPGEAVAKAIGFQPQSVSMVQESNAITQRMKDTYALNAEKIRSEWAKGVFEHDPDQIQKARDMLKEWNDKNPDQRIIVRIPDVMKKARDMAKDKDQRIADTAPKAMRAHLKQEIMQRKAYQ